MSAKRDPARYFRPLDGPAWARPITFLWRMIRFQPKAAAAATLASGLLGIIEGIGLSLLLPLLSLIGVGGAPTSGSPAYAIERGMRAAGIPISLIPVLAVFFAVGLLQILLMALQQYLIIRTGEAATLRLRERLFAAATRAGWTTLAAGRGGHLINSIVSESNRVGIVFGNCITAFGLLASFFVYLGMATWISWRFTLLTAGVGLISLIGLRRLYASSRRFGEYTSAASNRMQEVLNEHISAAKLIRGFGAATWSRRTFALAAAAVSQYTRRNQTNTILVKASVEPFGLLVLVTIVYLSVGIGLPIADLMLLLLIFYRITPRLVSLQETLQRIHGILPNYASVSRTLAMLEDAAERAGGRPFVSLQRGIELKDVTFAHGERIVLRDVNMTIPVFATVALLGASGGGKTTLLDLLTGVLQPQSGSVLVDGVPLDEIQLASYRSRIAIVAQDPTLFHDTIEANLRFANPDATEAELWEALAAARADAFVREMPKGLQSLAGDQGVRMSGGQRQRIALARALLRKPDVLLLDEPSSALDADTEASIRETFKSLRGKVTIVLVSHRLSLAEDADIVYAVGDGTVRNANREPQSA